MCNCRQNEFELLPELEALFNNVSGAYSNEYEVAAGKIKRKPAIPAYVSSFSGSADECAVALRAAGKTSGQALLIINEQIHQAIRMLRTAAVKLERGNRSAHTVRLFQNIFRVSPQFVPSWLSPTELIKDRGDVVAMRCKRVADLLASKRIRFFCSITSKNCPDCGNDNSPFACSSWGNESAAPQNSNVICLGQLFWNDMLKNDLLSIRSTLMHEPFHIYYGKYPTEHSHQNGKSVGKFGGIDCIVRFVFEINGYTATPADVSACKDYAVRSKAAGY